MFYGFVITEAGNRMLARQIAGDHFDISSVIMDKGTCADDEIARKLTAPIDPGPRGTHTVPIWEDRTVNFMVEYRSDLNGGLKEDFWIGGFCVYANNPDFDASAPVSDENPEEIMIYYGSLGDAKQKVKAYVPGSVPDTRRYPVSLEVTSGVTVGTAGPAEAWMTAEDVKKYVEGTLAPELLKTVTDLTAEHNRDKAAHPQLIARIRAAELALNGSETLTGSEDPTTETAGLIGQHYINTTTGREFVCTAYADERYIWDPWNEGDKSLRAQLTEAQATAQAAQEAADEANKKLHEAEEGGGIGGGSNIIKITFQAAFAGQPYTVTDGEDTKTGVVPESLTVSVRVANCNSTYTITATADTGVSYSCRIATGAYYGQYTAALSVFNTAINVTTAPGAEVTARLDSYEFTAVAGDNGVATVEVNQTGTYTVSATKDGASSESVTVAVTAEATYTATVKFIVLTVKSPAGSALTLTKDDKTFTVESTTGTEVFYLPSAGTWGGQITKGEDVATGSINCSAYQAYTLELAYKPVASVTQTSGVNYTNGISNLTPAQLSEIGEAISNNSAITNATSTVYIDHGANHWKLSVGDKIVINLNGDNYDFQIIGFNHDDLDTAAAYGKVTATGKAGITFQMVDCFKTTYVMNSSNTNVGGWKSSAMRTSTMATMKGYLSTAWKSALKTVRKKVSVGNNSSTLETVSDDCFLLSEVEIFGSTTYSAAGEGNQYAWYKAGNSKVKKYNGSANSWWERSPLATDANDFCRVNSNGSASANNANSSHGVAFGFCV